MKKLTVYRKCSCGETAHDYTGRRNERGRLVYACRNCRRERVPSDARSRRLAEKS
jgi:predicted SprT family Zn-dependent metalloprotease